MASLVTLAQAKRHLRLSAPGSPLTEEDEDVQQKLDAAEAIVLDYVTQRRDDNDAWAAEVALWSADDPLPSPGIAVPKQVPHAILLQLGDLYMNTGDHTPEDTPKREQGDLSQAVMALLYRLRDPALS